MNKFPFALKLRLLSHSFTICARLALQPAHSKEVLVLQHAYYSTKNNLIHSFMCSNRPFVARPLKRPTLLLRPPSERIGRVSVEEDFCVIKKDTRVIGLVVKKKKILGTVGPCLL